MPHRPDEISGDHNAVAPVTAGADSPLSLATLDDTELHTLRNLVMAEDMRRSRARKRAARKELYGQ